MAGLYQDAPSRRMAWDADGTVYQETSTTGNDSSFNLPVGTLPTRLYTDAASSRAELNDEDQVNVHLLGYYDNKWTSVLFPEPREFDGIYQLVGSTAFTTWATTSINTTNGYDGTWVNANYTAEEGTPSVDDWRVNIGSQAASSVVGLMLFYYNASTVGQYVKTVHLYGIISPGETPDRILFLDTENSDAEFSKVLDYGEVPRGQTQTRTIKIKNNSSTKTINTLQMIAEDLYLNAGGFYTFSLDDVSYQATLNTIGNLGPGATKLIYVKQAIPDAETLGLQTGRLKVAHASLT